MHSLVDAILAVGTDLEIRHVLNRVVTAACALVDATYGVILLGTQDRHLTDFVLHGFSADELRRIGEVPDFGEVLEPLFQSELPRRFSRVTGRPPGFPAYHPAISTLLEVPIAMRDETFGHIYLANKRGEAEFTEDDEDSILALVTAAAISIQNARLYEQERRRQQWLEAASEMTHLLLGEVNRDEALRTVTRLLRDVSGLDYAGMLLLDPAAPETVVLEAVVGKELEHTAGTKAPLQGLTARIVATGRGIVSQDLLKVEGADPPPGWQLAISEMGLGMLLPLRTPGENIGVLFAGWRRGSPHERLAAREAPLVEMFASQAALALQQVQAQDNRARLLVLEDRDRIAGDLHDAVIQRLFAIGTRLHSAVGLSTRPEVQRRITEAIDDLDKTTREVRSAIFQLHDHEAELPSLRDRLLAEVDASRELFGRTPRLVLAGAVDSTPVHLQQELIDAIREALVIAGKHGSPRQVEVVIEVDDDTLSLTVTDDGAGADQAQERVREAGIEALATHAERLGGSCVVRPDVDDRTALVWTSPLREPRLARQDR